MNDNTPDIDPNNVVPPTELERRRRVLACVEELADLAKDFSDRVAELRELHVPAEDWLPLLVSHAPEYLQVLYQRYGGFVTGAIDGFFDARAAGAKTGTEGMVAALLGHATRAATPQQFVKIESQVRGRMTDPEDGSEDELDYGFSALRMKKVLDRLFAEAPKMTDASGKPDTTQAPALECHVMLKGGGAIQGALSVTPEGTLRMLAPNQIGRGADAKPVMIEHFFDYEQIADVAVFREVKTSQGTRIVTS